MSKTNYCISVFLIIIFTGLCSGKIAVFYDQTLPSRSRIPNDFIPALKQLEIEFDSLDSKSISNLNIDKYECLIIPDSSVFPVGGAEILNKYVEQGGDIILFGGPPFSNCYDFIDGVWVRQKYKKYAGQWSDEREIRNNIALQNINNARNIFDFENTFFDDWQKISRFDSIGMKAVSDTGTCGKAVRIEIKNFNIGSWGLFEIDADMKFKKGDNCIYFSAKGDSNTPQMVFEIIEKDKSQWIAVIDLKPSWAQYSLTKYDFRHHPSEQNYKRGRLDDYVNMANCRKILVGISAYADTGGGDHNIWMDEIKAANINLPENLPTASNCSIKYFADYVPYLLKSPVTLHANSDMPSMNASLMGDVYAVEGFSVPDKSEFLPLLLTEQKNYGAETPAAGMTVNYDGQYKDSIWVYFGITDEKFYAYDDFKQYFKSLLKKLKDCHLVESVRQKNEAQKVLYRNYQPFNYILGTQAFEARYKLTGDDLLVEQAKAIYDMGSNILKCELSARASYIYDFKRKSTPKTLVELVSKSESYKTVFAMPFDYYILWTYECGLEFGGSYWRDGMTEKEKEKLYKEYYEFCCWLLKEFNNSRKTFYLGHWEGDWILLKGYKGTPTKRAIAGMIDWLNIRQKACDDAKKNIPHSNVEIYNYTEVTRVLDAVEGLDTLTNSVLPHTNIDYVSYSSYESADRSEGDDAIGARYKKSLDYLESKLPDKGVPGKRVFIGEYGFQRSYVSDSFEQERLCRLVVCAALEWGCPFILYWQMYCNTGLPQRNDSAGFWLIDNNGIKQPVYLMHYHYLQNARNFLTEFRKTNGRNPDNLEFIKAARHWLCPAN